MSDLKQQDRSYIQRYHKADSNEILAEIKGENFKKYRDAWNLATQRQVKAAIPLELNVSITSYCNLMCKMCYRNYINSKTKENMSMELVDSLARQAKELKIPSIRLGSFTEGTLHPEIHEVLRKFGSAEPLDYWLMTNGTQLTAELSETLVSIPLTRLSVSLDAATPETYKEIRGGDYAQVRKNIQDFLEIREKKNSRLPLLRVTFVDMAENCHEKELFIEQWKDVADIIDFQAFVDTSTLANQDIQEKNNHFMCSNPFNMIIVRHDGEILPCCYPYFEPDHAYNLASCTLMEYWNSDWHKSLEQAIITKNYPACCHRCINSNSY